MRFCEREKEGERERQRERETHSPVDLGRNVYDTSAL